MHAHAFKDQHCPSCKYAHICKYSLSQPPNTHTHTSLTQDALSSEFSDPAERRTNILMDSLCLRCIWIPAIIFVPFPFLSFSLPSRHFHKGLLIPRIHHSQHLNAFLQPDYHSPKPKRNCRRGVGGDWWLVVGWLLTSRSRAAVMSQRFCQTRAKEKQTVFVLHLRNKISSRRRALWVTYKVLQES